MSQERSSVHLSLQFLGLGDAKTTLLSSSGDVTQETKDVLEKTFSW